MTELNPVYDEVKAYLNQIRDLLDGIERSLKSMEGSEPDDRQSQPR